MGAHRRRPNVVLIMTDDQGAWALGAAGNTEIITPNLDRLAAEGLRCDRFFSASPVCSPARASLYTGLMPSAHGVHDWLSAGHVGEDGWDSLAGERLLTDDLADAGYRCGLVGKWHLGANDRPRPGFVHWFTHQSGGGPYFDAPLTRDGRLYQEHRYVTDVFTDDACAFIETETTQHPDTPFFLAVQYTAPHTPWKDNHPDELTSLYEDCEFASCPQEEPHPWSRMRPGGSHSEGEPDLRAALVGYFAAVTGVDRGVGRILAALDEAGIAEDTLVIFTSDNGFSCGQHGFWGKGNGTWPLNVYDASVLVPFIAWQPGIVPGGRVSSDLLSAYDLATTVVEHLGIPGGPGPTSPGRSFAPLLAGEPLPPRPEVVVGDEYGPVRMLRTSEWKLVRRYPSGPDELYELITDPGERHNLIDDPERQALVDELTTQMSGWFARHTKPLHDGRAAPVTGLGQTRPDHRRGAFTERP